MLGNMYSTFCPNFSKILRNSPRKIFSSLFQNHYKIFANFFLRLFTRNLRLIFQSIFFKFHSNFAYKDGSKFDQSNKLCTRTTRKTAPATISYPIPRFRLIRNSILQQGPAFVRKFVLSTPSPHGCSPFSNPPKQFFIPTSVSACNDDQQTNRPEIPS